jgi:hypothetical protein
MDLVELVNEKELVWYPNSPMLYSNLELPFSSERTDSRPTGALMNSVGSPS